MIEPGDYVEIEKDGKKWHGMVMPHHAFSGRDILVIKLDNGYNVGISIKNARIKLIRKGEKGSRKSEREIRKRAGEKIALLGTGGTIASYVDYRTGAVHPAATAEELAFSIPELFDVCDVDARIVFQKLSENITPSNWKKLAREVAKELNGGKKGVIISHGTDTMAYTASALAFMLKNLNGPVVMVGSQRSSDRPSSDAFFNLISAARVALTDLGEVSVVMHSSISSDRCYIHRATKVRKMHSSRRDAFVSINDEPIGEVGEKVIFYGNYRKIGDKKTVADTSINENVALVYYTPALSKEDFERLTGDKDGVIIAGTGLGHIRENLVGSVRKLIKDGIPVVMTTQCLNGSVNMNVYSTGRKLIKAGVINGKDMLPEVAMVKLMWVLGHESEMENIRKIMETNVAGEINERHKIS